MKSDEIFDNVSDESVVAFSIRNTKLDDISVEFRTKLRFDWGSNKLDEKFDETHFWAFVGHKAKDTKF